MQYLNVKFGRIRRIWIKDCGIENWRSGSSVRIVLCKNKWRPSVVFPSNSRVWRMGDRREPTAGWRCFSASVGPCETSTMRVSVIVISFIIDNYFNFWFSRSSFFISQSFCTTRNFTEQMQIREYLQKCASRKFVNWLILHKNMYCRW